MLYPNASGHPVVGAALVADALDTLGLRRQCLGAGLKPLVPGAPLVGLAFPVQIATVDELPDVPYQGLLRALDAIAEGEIYVASTGGASDVAIWGELITNACRSRGALGAICDGYARDTAKVKELSFPVFCRGTIPYDSNGRSEVVAHRVSVVVDDVTIQPGDTIVADDDGVVIVPQEVSADVLRRAAEKATAEGDFREAVRSGISATDAFARFGVL